MRYFQNTRPDRPIAKIIYTCVISGIFLLEPIALRAQVLPLAQGCVTCHGAKGQGSGAIPPINALAPEVFIAKMAAFNTPSETASIMPRFVTGLTEAEIAALAAWFKEQGQ